MFSFSCLRVTTIFCQDPETHQISISPYLLLVSSAICRAKLYYVSSQCRSQKPGIHQWQDPLTLLTLHRWSITILSILSPKYILISSISVFLIVTFLVQFITIFFSDKWSSLLTGFTSSSFVLLYFPHHRQFDLFKILTFSLLWCWLIPFIGFLLL